MKEATKLFLKIFIISLTCFIPIEFLYYYALDVYGAKVRLLVNLIAQDIIFSILGFIGFVICLNFYRLLKIKKEVSMAMFLLKPEEMTENFKLVWYASLIGIIGWSCYFIAVLMFIGIIPSPINKEFIEIFGDAFLFVSIFFVITGILIFNRWLKRLRKYV